MKVKEVVLEEGKYNNKEDPVISAKRHAMVDNMCLKGTYCHKSMLESISTRPFVHTAFAE